MTMFKRKENNWINNNLNQSIKEITILFSFFNDDNYHLDDDLYQMVMVILSYLQNNIYRLDKLPNNLGGIDITYIKKLSDVYKEYQKNIDLSEYKPYMDDILMSNKKNDLDDIVFKISMNAISEGLNIFGRITTAIKKIATTDEYLKIYAHVSILMYKLNRFYLTIKNISPYYIIMSYTVLSRYHRFINRIYGSVECASEELITLLLKYYAEMRGINGSQLMEIADGIANYHIDIGKYLYDSNSVYDISDFSAFKINRMIRCIDKGVDIYDLIMTNKSPIYFLFRSFN